MAGKLSEEQKATILRRCQVLMAKATSLPIPMRWHETLEKAGATIGAREPEILAVLAP